MFAEGDSKFTVVDPVDIGGDELELGLDEGLSLGFALGVGPAEPPPPDELELGLAEGLPLGDGDGFTSWLGVGVG